MVLFTVSFAAYTLLVVGVGIWSSRRAGASDEEYFLAGRSLGPWVASLSASASSESGWVTMGLVGWAFANGVQAFWILPGSLLGFAFNWFIIAGRLRRAAAQDRSVTLPDFLARHFKEKRPVLRIMSVIVILVAMLLYCAAQFAAAGKAFDVAFESIGYQGGVLIGAAIVLVYVTLGGFRAACWTDLLQGVLMVGVLVCFPLWLLLTGEGIAGIQSTFQDAAPGLLGFWPSVTGSALIGFLLGSGALGINFGYMGQPHVLIRFMAMRSPREARLGGMIAITWAALVLSGAVTVGIIVRSMAMQGAPWASGMLATGDGEYALVAAAIHMAPPVLGGLVLAAILAAICSTADSQLVVASSAWANDLWARMFTSKKKASHAVVNRLTVIIMGALAVLLVIDQRVTVYEYVLSYGWAILGASFGPQIILALMWRGATWMGAICGMGTGFAVALGWKLIMDNQITIGGETVEIYNLPLAFLAALTVNILVSLVSSRST